MWLMLQQDEPDDYVDRHRRDALGPGVRRGRLRLVGLDWERLRPDRPRYFRPTEVDSCCGDASKAERVLGWRAADDASASWCGSCSTPTCAEAGLDPATLVATPTGRAR